jgi:hypothetical protein
MGKIESRGEHPEFFAKGGSGKMFGKGHANTKVPGISGKASQGDNEGIKPEHLGESEGYTSGVRYLDGGSTKMFGKGHAGKKVPGISGKADQSG